MSIFCFCSLSFICCSQRNNITATNFFQNNPTAFFPNENRGVVATSTQTPRYITINLPSSSTTIYQRYVPYTTSVKKSSSTKW